MSEGAFHQLVHFKDKADRLNILKLPDMDAFDRFLDFSSVPHHPDYFPLDEKHKNELDKYF